MEPWVAHCSLTDKKGRRVPLPKALEQLDSIDFSKPAYLFETPNSRTSVSHDLLLLSLSAEKYPVAIEQIVRKFRKDPDLGPFIESLRRKPQNTTS